MSVSLQVADERKVNRISARAKGRPEVSVILVSDGCWVTMERSLARVATRCRRMLAEVIAVASGDDEVPQSLQSNYPEVRFCRAPAGSGEAQLRSLAMLEASGDIVALRRVADVSDTLWLDAHFRVATGTEPDLFDEADWAEHETLSDHAIGTGESVLADVVGQSSRRVHYPVDTSQASSASSAA